MKKKIILFMLIIFLTGCSAEYNLDFSEGVFSENIKIGQFNSREIADFDYFEPHAIYTDDVQEYYDLDYTNQYLNLSHNYSLYKFKLSETMNKCFDSASITSDNDYYYIIASGEFKCMSYDGYTTDKTIINFTTDLEVSSTNADYITNDAYSWVLNNNNYKNKEITIKLKINKETENKEQEENTIKNNTTTNILNNETVMYFVIIIPLGIIVYIIYKILKKHSIEKDNFED